MQFFGIGKFPQILGLGLMLVALLAVACGEAAAPTSPPPAVQATEAPQTAAQPTAVPAPIVSTSRCEDQGAPRAR